MALAGLASWRCYPLRRRDLRSAVLITAAHCDGLDTLFLDLRNGDCHGEARWVSRRRPARGQRGMGLPPGRVVSYGFQWWADFGALSAVALHAGSPIRNFIIIA